MCRTSCADAHRWSPGSYKKKKGVRFRTSKRPAARPAAPSTSVYFSSSCVGFRWFCVRPPRPLVGCPGGPRSPPLIRTPWSYNTARDALLPDSSAEIYIRHQTPSRGCSPGVQQHIARGRAYCKWPSGEWPYMGACLRATGP
jgi:hypothetical protein